MKSESADVHEARGSLPTEPRRVRAFASFFKNYMSISSLITASLPIPVTLFKLIPMYEAQKKYLGVYIPMFCFLILGFVFFSRHKLARYMIPQIERVWTRGFKIRGTLIRLLPLLLIFSSLSFVVSYQQLLHKSIYKSLKTSLVEKNDLEGRKGEGAIILENVEFHQIPYSVYLQVLYFGIFLSAMSSFILMALKEYLQDILKISDVDLIIPKYVSPRKKEERKKAILQLREKAQKKKSTEG